MRANLNRQHAANYQNKYIDTTTAGQFLHGAKAALLESVAGLWLEQKLVGSGLDVWHAGEVTYKKSVHSKISATRWGADVWVFAPEGEDGESFDKGLGLQVPERFVDRKVAYRVEVKKRNWLTRAGNKAPCGNWLEGEWVLEGPSLPEKEVGIGVIGIAGMVADSLEGLVLTGWYWVDEAHSNGKLVKYGRGQSGMVASPSSMYPMRSLPSVLTNGVRETDGPDWSVAA